MNYRVQEVAQNLGYQPLNCCQNYPMATGDVRKRVYPKDAVRPARKLTSPVKLYILHTVLQHPEMYLKELQVAKQRPRRLYSIVYEPHNL